MLTIGMLMKYAIFSDYLQNQGVEYEDISPNVSFFCNHG